MICEAYEREATTVLETIGFNDVTLVTYPASILHLRMEWDEIIEKIHACEDESQIIFIRGSCLVGLGDQPKELDICHYFELNQCFSMFINKSIINSYIKQGAYLLSPTWLKNWREHMEEYAFDKKKAQEFFKTSNTKLVLLDTGVYEDSEENLREFANFVGLPFEILPIGLDYFTLFLKKIILECRLKETTGNPINNNVGELASSLNIDVKPSIIEEEKEKVVLLIMNWDDKRGPTLETYFPTKTDPESIESIGFQLFHSVASIYGQYKIHKAQGILLNVENIQMQGYIFFDAIADPEVRGGERPFMMSVIAPKINYFESIRIREIFKIITQKIKKGLDWDIKNYWEKILHILSTSVL